MLTYSSYVLGTAGGIGTIAGVIGMEANVNRQPAFTDYTKIALGSLTIGCGLAVVFGVLGKDYEINHRDRYRLIFAGKQLTFEYDL